MVFLPLRRRDGVAARGPAQALALVHNRCGGILRYHKPAVEAGTRHKERRQAACAGYQLVCAALRYARQLSKSHGKEVHRHGYRLAVEVAGRNYYVLVGEHGRIVGRAVDFVFEHRPHVFQSIAHGAMHLRYAAERIRVLHVFFGTRYKGASLKQGAHMGGNLYLSAMVAHFVHLGAERLYTPVKSIERHRRNLVGLFGKTPRLKQAPHAVGTHKLCAVEQCQAFLAFQAYGTPAEYIEYLAAFEALAIMHYFALADQGQEEIGQGGKVARCAE